MEQKRPKVIFNFKYQRRPLSNAIRPLNFAREWLTLATRYTARAARVKGQNTLMTSRQGHDDDDVCAQMKHLGDR